LRWQTISTRTLLGSRKELKWQFEHASQHQRLNKKQKSHVNASPTSSAPSTSDLVSLGEDSEPLIYQEDELVRRL
jgi:hypothetical protein